MSWYKSDLLAGNHDFKGGFDYLLIPGGASGRSRDLGENYQLQFNNGAPFQIATYNTPVTPMNDRAYLGPVSAGLLDDRPAADAQSGRPLRPRQRVCAGAMPRGRGLCGGRSAATEVQMNVWNSVAPRLHAAYDLFGDGKNRDQGRLGALRSHAREISAKI